MASSNSRRTRDDVRRTRFNGSVSADVAVGENLALTTFDRPGAPRGALLHSDRPLMVAPLVPEHVLRREHAFVSTDTRFAAASRLLASIWRKAEGLTIGTFADARTPNASKVKLGSRLSTKAARAGRTFVEPAIARYAREALLFRESGSVWDEGRLWGNLLSSQALTLNFLAPLALDLELATRVWRRLLPGFVGTVERLRFEHSPGRFENAWFGDGTAFDAIVELRTPEGETGVITIEVKFVEAMVGPAATHRLRYEETTLSSGLFEDPTSPTLFRAGFEQLRREHTMTQLMIDYGLAETGRFVLIGPRLNRRVAAHAKIYAAELEDALGTSHHRDGRRRAAFDAITVEAVIEALADEGEPKLATQLWGRYCDLQRVATLALEDDGTVSAADSAPSSPKRATPSPDAALVMPG